MKRTVLIAASAALVFGAAALGGVHDAAAQSAPAAPPAAAAAPAPPGDAAHGKQLFTQTYGCWECHGTVGQGGSAGATIGPPPLPYSALLAYIRRPSGQMPSYAASILPDKDVADIYAYLKSIPPAKSAKSIPLLAGDSAVAGK